MTTKTLEHPFSERKRVLLVGAASPDRDRISTFLSTMGWAWSTVSGVEEMLAAARCDPFDAVLMLDLDCSGVRAERAILVIREIRPSLLERIIAISRGNLSPQTSELIERYNLAELPHERLYSHLCVMLENLRNEQGANGSRSGKTRTARLVFDSLHLPSPPGVRRSSASGRHLTYKCDSTFIEIFLDRPFGEERISLAGQVIESTKGQQGNPPLPVILVDQSGTVARTATTDSGEFNLEFGSAENVSLEIRLGERSWVSIPLWLTDLAKVQTASIATEG